MTDYRQQIRDLLARKGIGVWATTKRAGIHPATLYNYLKGQSEITAVKLALVLDTLNRLPDKHSVERS